MVPHLRTNDFDGAVTLAVGEMAQAIASDAGVTLDQVATAPATDYQPVHRRFRWPSSFC